MAKVNPTTPGGPPQPAPAERGESPPQSRWLTEAIGQVVRCRLLDGKAVVGELVGFDRFTLEVRQPGETETALLLKHAIAYVKRDGGAT